MSAFASLQDNDATEDVIKYEQNSSDDDTEEGFRSSAQPQAQQVVPPWEAIELATVDLAVYNSNFSPNQQNFAMEGKTSYVGLSGPDHIIVCGQFKLTVLLGTLLINDCHQLKSSEIALPITVTHAQGLLLFGSVPSESTSSSPNLPVQGETIIKLEQNFTGLEKISTYAPLYKRLLPPSADLLESDAFQARFYSLSYEIISGHSPTPAVSISGDQLKALDAVTSFVGKPKKASVVCIVGGKNSGKSTFAKALSNQVLLQYSREVCYLETDPGQSEGIPPYCLGLLHVSQPLLGMLEERVTDTTAYFGYSSPAHHPKLYLQIIRQLLDYYQKHHATQRHPLIINTPGWIKGFGKELLRQICDMISIDHLVIMGQDDEENLAETLTHNMHHFVPCLSHQPTFSAPHIRTLAKLCYFHRHGHRYDFDHHLLDNAPYKVSYGVEGGIRAMSVLNYDCPANFQLQDLVAMVEVTIMAVYVVDPSIYERIPVESGDEVPNYIQGSTWLELEPKTTLLGLAMIHSIDTNRKTINLYLGPEVIERVDEGAIVLVKGEGEIPPCELLNPGMLSSHKRHLDVYNDHKKSGAATDLVKPVIPYVSSDDKERVGGVWRVRRNIGRKGR
ncbi:hypothetical protein DIURU_000521 [Diutina rugosa]|uniref:Polynucleotide 5'-hydroxyl-kinase GRC3 n=1 Tax=Diutina rugosa TaxID=5481 RepID=A0A642UXN5_DIURU|nr:uncharacterized protein DIURU_000521 [Diutina rugosa]KAA8907514.1 hypothetical protein DIURU_000521 [Diutina rugosa]